MSDHYRCHKKIQTHGPMCEFISCFLCVLVCAIYSWCMDAGGSNIGASSLNWLLRKPTIGAVEATRIGDHQKSWLATANNMILRFHSSNFRQALRMAGVDPGWIHLPRHWPPPKQQQRSEIVTTRVDLLTIYCLGGSNAVAFYMDEHSSNISNCKELKALQKLLSSQFAGWYSIQNWGSWQCFSPLIHCIYSDMFKLAKSQLPCHSIPVVDHCLHPGRKRKLMVGEGKWRWAPFSIFQPGQWKDIHQCFFQFFLLVMLSYVGLFNLFPHPCILRMTISCWSFPSAERSSRSRLHLGSMPRFRPELVMRAAAFRWFDSFWGYHSSECSVIWSLDIIGHGWIWFGMIGWYWTIVNMMIQHGIWWLEIWCGMIV